MVVLNVFYFPFINTATTNTGINPQEDRTTVAWCSTLSMINEVTIISTEGTSSNILRKSLKKYFIEGDLQKSLHLGNSIIPL